MFKEEKHSKYKQYRNDELKDYCYLNLLLMFVYANSYVVLLSGPTFVRSC